MYYQPVRSVMEARRVLKAPPQTSVSDASQMMAKKNVGAVMVVENDQLIGIFTERDVVFRVVARGLDPKSTQIAAVMTPSPKTVDPDKPFGYALLMMHKHGFRHVPVVEHGKPIGMVSARNALDPDMEEFVAEAQRRKHIEELN
jgi:CBS domain-containing protein